MKIHVEILDDNGLVVAEHEADASTPSRWTAASGQKLVSKMSHNASDVENNGTYELFGITFQPIVRVDRPNGWTPPIPGPNNAPPISSYPQGFPSSLKPKTMWGPLSPTQNNPLTEPGARAYTRG